MKALGESFLAAMCGVIIVLAAHFPAIMLVVLLLFMGGVLLANKIEMVRLRRWVRDHPPHD